VRLCSSVCTTWDCFEACDSASDAGVALAVALGKVTAGPCTGACARGADWSCVGRVGWPKPTSDTVRMTIQVKDFETGSIFYGVDVKVCERTDVNCDNPRAQGTIGLSGSVVLQFPNPLDFKGLGLDGYVQLQSPEFLPWLFYWGFPLSEPELVLADSPLWGLTIRVLTLNEASAVGTSLGGSYDPGKSLLIATVHDCESHIAPGVQVTTNPADPDAGEFYGLSPTLTATDGYGFATFAGLPTGSVDVIATPLALGKTSSRQTVTLRHGWVTAPIMLPTPL
jgi:hypothetical protein